MAALSEPDPILRVTVGSLIYTSDDEKIGSVGEVQGNAFKVATPLLRRDYWLTGDIIASATSDGPVILAIDKAHLDECRIEEPSAAA
jgi:hypothetical protein